MHTFRLNDSIIPLTQKPIRTTCFSVKYILHFRIEGSFSESKLRFKVVMAIQVRSFVSRSDALFLVLKLRIRKGSSFSLIRASFPETKLHFRNRDFFFLERNLVSGKKLLSWKRCVKFNL